MCLTFVQRGVNDQKIEQKNKCGSTVALVHTKILENPSKFHFPWKKHQLLLPKIYKAAKLLLKVGQYHKSSNFFLSLHVNAHCNSHRLGNTLWTLSPSTSSAKVEAFQGLKHQLVASPHLAGPQIPQIDMHSEFMALLQHMQDNAQAQQQRAKERAERQEARHEAQMAAMAAQHSAPHTISPATPKVPTGFKSNQCFFKIAPFSGEEAHPLRPWFNDSDNEFQNTVDVAGLVEDEARCELRLKLIGVPGALYSQSFRGDDARLTIRWPASLKTLPPPAAVMPPAGVPPSLRQSYLRLRPSLPRAGPGARAPRGAGRVPARGPL